MTVLDSAVLYRGPSMLDGKPIVAIATADSGNAKTGPMVQTWIIRSHVPPMEAVRRGLDASVCGDCPQRHYLGGGCYVLPFNAPRSIYDAWRAGLYDDPECVTRLRVMAKYMPIRLGAYGDPVAVPAEVWERFLKGGCGKRSGYTHQWRRPEAARYRRFLMASVDSVAEAKEARAAGWRYFRVTREDDALPHEVECVNTATGLTCAECAMCNGTDDRERPAASVRIRAHGARAKRYALQVVK